jgi:hypothetical protein
MAYHSEDTCPRCQGTGWICDIHRDQPWPHVTRQACYESWDDDPILIRRECDSPPVPCESLTCAHVRKFSLIAVAMFEALDSWLQIGSSLL